MPPNPPPNRPPPGRQQQSSSEGSSATPGPSGTGGTARGGSASGRGRPVGRLQSLKKRTPGGSLVPLNPDGSTPKPTLKFQPKVVTRKSKEEREALENLEAERLRDRISAASAARRSSRGGDRGRGGRGRGRGGAGGASGPLGGGAGPGGRHGGGKWKGKGSRSTKLSSVYGFKSEGGAGEDHDSRDVSSDEGSDYGLRFSIDHINLESDSEGEVAASGATTKGKAPLKTSTPTGGNRGLRPVRVERHEHVERSTGITSEASATASKSAELRRQAKEKAGAADDSLFVEDDRSDDSDVNEDDDVVMGEIKGSVPSTDGPRIKTEPTDEIAAIDDTIAPISEEAVPKEPKKPKKKIIDPRKKLQTEEERQEYDRHEEDVDYLKSTLGSLATAGKAPDSSATEVGKKDEDEAEGVIKPQDERQGQLFLLQFPPMTPNLLPPTTEKTNTGEQDEAAVETAAPLPTGTTPEAQGSVTIKREEVTANPAANTGIPSPLVTATNSALPRGRVGKLNIHKSGRATIDWGGVSFELTKGSSVGFIQDAVLLSDSIDDGAGNGSSDRDKKLWAMSQVTGKFVVTPDWEKILDE
ncbi:hypothetical protein FQN49_000295 [Arthroderma sp. PD_2]|nr:hypothetical protein FQN49_000295 [Arthroderma sp. PD_2]